MKKEIHKTQSCTNHRKTQRIKVIDAIRKSTLLTFKMKKKKIKSLAFKL